MYIERALEPLVRRYSENFKIVAVTGPRQVGKTTMLKHLMEEEAESGVDRVYVTLDKHGDSADGEGRSGAFPAALSSACSD